MRHMASRTAKVKPAACDGGQTPTICLSATAVAEANSSTTTKVNKSAATAAGVKTARPANKRYTLPRLAGRMVAVPGDARGEERSEVGAEEDLRARAGDALRP